MKLRRMLAAVVACCLMAMTGSVATASAAPPVVDQFNWVDGEPITPSVGMFPWSASGGGDYEQRDECDVDMEYSCDTFPDGGPLIRAGSPGSYPAGSKAERVYTVPGGPDAYIKEVSAVGINAQLGTAPSEPHAFIGLWNGSSWTAKDTNDDLGYVALEEEEGEEGDRQVRFGLEADSAVTPADEHWAGMARMTAELGDDGHPVLDYDPGDIPTGWVNEDPFTIAAPAYDEGLGLFAVVAFSSSRGATPWAPGAGTWGDGWSGECQGNTESPCPLETDPGLELEVRPAEIREGVNTMAIAAVDANFNQSNNGAATVFDLKVDTINPKVDLSGSFMSAPGMVLTGSSYTLNTDATDGEPWKENSGVVEIKVLVDDVVIDSKSASCATENCEMDLKTEIEPDDYTNGEHLLKVKVKDAVGHVRTRITDFEVDR